MENFFTPPQPTPPHPPDSPELIYLSQSQKYINNFTSRKGKVYIIWAAASLRKSESRMVVETEPVHHKPER